MTRRLFLAATSLWVATACSAAEPAAGAMQKIRVSSEGARFVFAESGETFVPWGFNYVGSFGEIVEEYWEEDWPRVEKDFRQMRSLGANVVRLHLQFGTYMKQPGEIDQAQLDRLRKLLDLGQQTGLYLDLTGLNLFRLKDIPDWYDQMEEAERWDLQAKWWSAIAKTCAGHPAVFCYDLTNEPVIGGERKEGEPRWVGGELGGFYFVQRLTDKLGERSREEIAEAWVQTLTTAIRQEDAKTLITVGVIPWAHVWPNAKPLFYSPAVGRHLDFASIHMYPKAGEVEKAIKATAVYDVGKPLVIEEIFPLSCSIDELEQYIDGTKDRADGYIAHYFGRTIEEHSAGAEPAGPIVAEFLKYWREKGKSITNQ